ncbi:MAG TPA: DUF4234 domain-containing protein [Thermodesulfobacteriota bacterium]|jgi:hypothetical protein|nr:DUF4234 domain-containing protein [Thermodesulfobacteriota bacterium]
MERPPSPIDQAELRSFKVSIARYVILSIITLGIFNIYWQYIQMKFVNLITGEERFSFVKWLLFTIVTCGIYHLYYEYVMGREITMLQERFGLPKSGDLPTISIVLSILGLTLVTDAIQQREINMIVDMISAKAV